MKDLELRAVEALTGLLGEVPIIELKAVKASTLIDNHEIDLLVSIDVAGHPHTLVCEIKSDVKSHHVPLALLKLGQRVASVGTNSTPVLLAPYFPPKAQELCRTFGAGFLDLEGNARLVFDGVFIERHVASKPAAERRELKSIFKPKAAQVLRTMLRDPQHTWRVTELAEAAGVSLGHVSNVRTALLDRDWAGLDPGGLFLTAPDALLDAWRDVYDPPAGVRTEFYTVLHGKAFEEAVRRASCIDDQAGNAVLASFSAAHWLAPYARTGSHSFYADETGLDLLKQALKLSFASKGANIIVNRLSDIGIFRDTVEPAPGIFCTSPVQTYLDLSCAGERGVEAAEHLRLQKLNWSK
ncbi:hypothetical protein SAE02_32700 [Skermanella aerolata]|uniref:Transcriptional regulator n=1 Tax=Skermanella aerolata TaxID=393310 RepID=A0A512DRK7_9PROT|nr:type IV toxin-antitoxin system AbiEi family antitoxin [Skermanella aerolata]KJB93169.1 hypothetical protein N826_16525 [Skermanella aerolata KACC 11604]GEO39122.1 hypothetical protein SAE02_32700 [Skermanella aerolata]